MKKLEKIDEFYSKVNEDIAGFRNKDGDVKGGEVTISNFDDVCIDIREKAVIDQITLVEYGMMSLLSLLDSKSSPGWRKKFESGQIQKIKINNWGNKQVTYKEKDVSKLSKEVRAFMKKYGIVYKTLDWLGGNIVFDTQNSVDKDNMEKFSKEEFEDFVLSMSKVKGHSNTTKTSDLQYNVQFEKKGVTFVVNMKWNGTKPFKN